MYVRDESVMGTPAFINSIDDRITTPNPNPMYPYDKEAAHYLSILYAITL
jgi:hypothetical protein